MSVYYFLNRINKMEADGGSSNHYYYHKDEVAAILDDLISSTDTNEYSRLNELREIKSIEDPKTKAVSSLRYLYKFYKQSDITISRLCSQLNGHIELLYRLVENPETISLFLISRRTGKVFLEEATKSIMREQASRTSEMISTLVNEVDSPLYTLNNLLRAEYNSEKRTEQLSKLISDETLTMDELKYLCTQESFMVQVLLDYYRVNSKKPSSQSTSEIKAALEYEYEEQLRLRGLELKSSVGLDLDLNASFNRNYTYEDIMKIEEKIRTDYEIRLMEEKKRIKERLESDYRAVQQSRSPPDQTDPMLMRKLREKITNEIRSDVIEDLRRDLEDELTIKLRPLIKKDVKKEYEDKIRRKVETEMKQALFEEVKNNYERELRIKVRNDLEDEIRNNIITDVRANEINKIKSELRRGIESEVRDDNKRYLADYKRTLDKQMEETINQRIPIIEQDVRCRIESETVDKLTAKIRIEERKKIRNEIYESVAEEAREDIEERLRDEIEREMRNKLEPLRAVPEWMIESTKKDIKRKLDAENREYLQRMESDLREAIFEEIRARTLEELSSSHGESGVNASFNNLSSYPQLKKMFRDEFETEVRLENEKKHQIPFDKIEQLRAELRSQIVHEIADKVRKDTESTIEAELRLRIEEELRRKHSNDMKNYKERVRRELRSEVESELKEYYTPRKPPINVEELKRQLRDENERELRMKLEGEIRAQVENEVHAKLKSNQNYKTEKIKKTIIEEIRESFSPVKKRTNTTDSGRKNLSSDEIEKLRKEVEEAITPEVEAKVRNKFFSVVSDVQNNIDIIPESDIQDIISRLRSMIRNNYKHAFIHLLRQQIEANFMKESPRLFELICHGLGITDIPEFSKQLFFQLTERLAQQNIAIRKRYKLTRDKELVEHWNDMVEVIRNATTNENLLRSLLTRVSSNIEQVKTEGSAESWRGWALELYKRMTGREFDSENPDMLRDAIDQNYARSSAELLLAKQRNQGEVLVSPLRNGSPVSRMQRGRNIISTPPQ